MKFVFTLFIALFIGLHSAFAADPDLSSSKIKVIGTLKPLSEMAKAILGDTAEVETMIKDPNMVHDYAISPNQVKLLKKAELILWVDPSLESFMPKYIDHFELGTKALQISKMNDITLLPLRSGGNWGHDPDHDHDHDHKHDHNEADEIDPHLWLSLENTLKIADIIRLVMGNKYPQNQALYNKNYDLFMKKIRMLQSEMHEKYKEKSSRQAFLVYHDAFQYFEQEFRFEAKGAFTFNPHIPLSPKRAKDLTTMINGEGVKCIFVQEGYNSALLQKIKDEQGVYIGSLDDIGTNIPAESDYFSVFYGRLRDQFAACFEQK